MTHPPTPASLPSSELKAYALKLGANAVGIAPAAPATNSELFAEWLRRGYAGDMAYLARYPDLRFDPRRLLEGARSVIVIGLNYYPSEEDLAQAGSPYKVAKYAWGEDYHRILRKLLARLRTWLADRSPGAQGRICVDTAPFPDKYWAQRAGLGWQGKHSNLVSRDFGSWLFIGSLITNISFAAYDQPHLDFCGSCTACLNRCPTEAFPQPYVLDATRCISYWTIESKSQQIPRSIAQHMEHWVFGCDICLDICPWNKFQKPHTEQRLSRLSVVQSIESGKLDQIGDTRHAGAWSVSPLRRSGRNGLLRNQIAADSA